jgi:hypothetical protein
MKKGSKEQARLAGTDHGKASDSLKAHTKHAPDYGLREARSDHSFASLAPFA